MYTRPNRSLACGSRCEIFAFNYWNKSNAWNTLTDLLACMHLMLHSLLLCFLLFEGILVSFSELLKGLPPQNR